MKTCKRCGLVKPVQEFYNRVDTKDGKTSHCKDCLDKKNRLWASRNRHKSKLYSLKWRSKQPDYRWAGHILRKYGISEDEYQRMLDRQDGKCAICRKPEKRILRGRIRRLSIDHDHKTKKIRGLLCDDCNTGIAKLGEDTQILVAAIKYLGGMVG